MKRKHCWHVSGAVQCGVNIVKHLNAKLVAGQAMLLKLAEEGPADHLLDHHQGRQEVPGHPLLQVNPPHHLPEKGGGGRRKRKTGNHVMERKTRIRRGAALRPPPAANLLPPRTDLVAAPAPVKTNPELDEHRNPGKRNVTM